MDKMAATVVTLLFFTCRHAKTVSARTELSQGISRTSRLVPRRLQVGPNRRRVSVESTPSATASAIAQRALDLVQR